MEEILAVTSVDSLLRVVASSSVLAETDLASVTPPTDEAESIINNNVIKVNDD